MQNQKLKEETKKIVEKKLENMKQMISEEMINENNEEVGYVDIIKIAEEFGFTVGNANISEEEHGFIYINEKQEAFSNSHSSKIIGVNSNLSLEWKRFVIAHELGHYFLHYMDNAMAYKGMYAHRENKKGKGDEEQEADYFAACLLMPKDIFSKKYEKISDGFNKSEIAFCLSKQFIVTQIMAERRIEELKLKKTGS